MKKHVILCLFLLVATTANSQVYDRLVRLNQIIDHSYDMSMFIEPTLPIVNIVSKDSLEVIEPTFDQVIHFSLKDIICIGYSYSRVFKTHDVVFYTKEPTIKCIGDEVEFYGRYAFNLDTADSAMVMISEFGKLYKDLGLKIPLKTCAWKKSDDQNLRYLCLIVNKPEVEGVERWGVAEDITGTIVVRWPNGKLRLKKSFKNGLCHGTMKEYNQNGKLTYQANHKMGIRHGETIHWDGNGNIVLIQNYENGDLKPIEK